MNWGKPYEEHCGGASRPPISPSANSSVRGVGSSHAPAAPLATVVPSGGVAYAEHRVRLRGEQARDQLLEALRITEIQLEWVRERINRPSGGARSETEEESRI